MAPIVVKLGGSLYHSSALKPWLQSLLNYSKQQAIIIVPGGGPFADQVRDAQSLHQFDDKTAHHMALMAMKQFGLLLIGLEPSCMALTLNVSNHSGLSVWLPNDSILKESSIEQSWNISSDSLALWLSQRLGAEQLLLIKSIQPTSNSINILSQQGIIDAGFTALYAEKEIMTKVLYHDSSPSLLEKLSDHSLNLSL